MHSLLTYFPSINIVQDLPFKTPAFVCPIEKRGGGTLFRLDVTAFSRRAKSVWVRFF